VEIESSSHCKQRRCIQSVAVIRYPEVLRGGTQPYPNKVGLRTINHVHDHLVLILTELPEWWTVGSHNLGAWESQEETPSQFIRYAIRTAIEEVPIAECPRTSD
jgi:hypothetical protein